MRSDGRGKLTKWQKLRLGLSFWLMRKAAVTIEVGEGEAPYKFRCDNRRLARRAATLLSKEEGTVAWLKAVLRPGAVFLDIGANIGVYTLIAARSVGESGRVYAFEPHIPNANRLFENITANGLQRQVSVITAPLTDRPAVGTFRYNEYSAGSAHSEFESSAGAGTDGVREGPEEIKLGTSIDALIQAGAIVPPDAIKIDIDGLEPQVLAGMKELLNSDRPPASIQVEVEKNTLAEVVGFLEGNGYVVDHRHFTHAGKKHLKSGTPESEITHNVVFTRKAVGNAAA